MRSVMVIEGDMEIVIALRRLVIQATSADDLMHRNYIWHEQRENPHMGPVQPYEELQEIVRKSNEYLADVKAAMEAKHDEDACGD